MNWTMTSSLMEWQHPSDTLHNQKLSMSSVQSCIMCAKDGLCLYSQCLFCVVCAFYDSFHHLSCFKALDWCFLREEVMPWKFLPFVHAESCRHAAVSVCDRRCDQIYLQWLQLCATAFMLFQTVVVAFGGLSRRFLARFKLTAAESSGHCVLWQPLSMCVAITAEECSVLCGLRSAQ